MTSAAEYYSSWPPNFTSLRRSRRADFLRVHLDVINLASSFSIVPRKLMASALLGLLVRTLPMDLL